MKVSRNTPDLLIIDHVPWLWAIVLSTAFMTFISIGLGALFNASEPGMVLFGLIFAVIGGGLWFLMLVLFVKRLQFIFDRQRDLIVIRRRSILRHSETTQRLAGLARVKIEETRGNKGGLLYRPVLVFEPQSGQPDLPLHSYYTSGRGSQRTADAINAWLAAGA